jgi:hypothetical protein
MKKLFLCVFLFVWASYAIAQNMDSLTIENKIERKNVVKFLPVNVPFQSISFEYERMINAKNSVTLGIGLPNQKSLIGKYGIDFGTDMKSLELGTMHIRAAFRHYTGDQMLPKGFYLEPYLKYQHISGTARVVGEKVESGYSAPYSGDFDVKLNSMNLGFQLGAQFLIAKRVTLDLYFIGFEAGLLSGNVTAVSDQIAQADNLKGDIEDAIKNLPSFIGDKLKVTQSADKKTIGVKASGVPYPWLRGGISIGIAF